MAIRRVIDLPNISFRLAEQLGKVGVAAADTLFDLGTEAVFRKLREAGIRPEFTSLLALEGAILGVGWQSVPRDRRRVLMMLADA